MTVKFARRVSMLVGGLALAGVLAACGSSTSTGQSSPPTASTPSSSTPSSQSGPASSSPAASTSPSASPSPSPSASAAPSPAAAAVVITIKDYKYQVPKSVKPGAKVTVMNMDRVVHTVTADTSNSLFDVNVDPGVPASFTAPTKPGTYTFHCTYHANMHGTLVVS